MLKILELFGGIGACSKAFERLGIDYEIADYVEIDKYAVKSFNAIHNTNFEPQDITKWDKDIEVDLVMHGSPCQDFSLAGLQAGGDEGSGTRSSLMYETIRIVKKLRPKYVIWENVKNVISKKHIHNFNNYLDRMNELGYTSCYQVLNAKDYGIPQNRERVFTISIRNDLNQSFIFPEKQELKLRLKDMLEDEVDDKYYLSKKMIDYISAVGTANFKNCDSKINLDIARPLTTDQNKRAGTTNYLSKQLPSNYNLLDMHDNNVKEIGFIEKGTGQHQSNTIYDINGLCPTICSAEAYKSPYKFLVKNATKQGYLEATDGDGIDISSRMQHHRGTVQKESIQTLTTQNNLGVCVIGGIGEKKSNGGTQWYQQDRIYDNNIGLSLSTTANPYYPDNQLRIRKLTPCECWKLMGFDKSDFDKASKVNSNAQLYKQAGNSIVVNVLENILKNLL